MEGLDDVFGEPNGPAYESRQTRTGPPLEYVSEKLGNALKHLHRTVRSIERFVPDSLMPSERDRPADIAVKERLHNHRLSTHAQLRGQSSRSRLSVARGRIRAVCRNSRRKSPRPETSRREGWFL